MTRGAIRPIAETADSVTLSKDDFDALMTLLEDAADLADIEAVSRRVAVDGTEPLPAAVVHRILDGTPAVTALRDHRGLTAADLARRAAVAPSTLAAIEAGTARGDVDALRRIADVLDVPLDLLVATPAP